MSRLRTVSGKSFDDLLNVAPGRWRRIGGCGARFRRE